MFLDIRNSTQLNQKYEKNLSHLYEIYSFILNDSFNILKRNGFKNIEIQGDGIYGLMSYEKNVNKLQSIKKTLKELEIKIDEAYEKHQVKTTISLRQGKEYYAAFGSKENGKYKQLAYFGNVVSMTKKMNSSSIESKIVISMKTFSSEEINKMININKYDKSIIKQDIYLSKAGNLGPVLLIKW